MIISHRRTRLKTLPASAKSRERSKNVFGNGRGKRSESTTEEEVRQNETS